MSTPFVIFCLICTAITWALAHAYRRAAFRADILAHPNARSAHEVPTPTGAGVAFIGVWLVAVLLHSGGFSALNPAWYGPLAAAVVGFIDDRRELPVLPRALTYAVACLWTIYCIGFPALAIGGSSIDLGIFGYAFGFLSLLWLMNLYNFMDGIDGIAAGEAIFVIGAALAIGMTPAPEAALLLAVCAGFAVINWPQAKVFMGDAGSSFLGLALGALALMEVAVSVWVWMILLAYFITDACLTISIRLVRGEPVYQAHSQHAYQHLTRRYGAAAALYTVLAVNLVWLLPIAFLAHRAPDQAAFLLVFAAIPLLACQFLCGAGQPEPKLESLKPRGSREAAI